MPRRAPYWGPPIERGQHIGIRKNPNGTFNWIARRFDEESRSYRYKALGKLSQNFDYSNAKRAAMQWFADADLGVPDTAPTVADACRDYVADLAADGRASTANDARRRFERTVVGRPKAKYVSELPAQKIAAVRLDRLRTKQLKEWRNGLGGKKSSQNRNLAALKAALNLAVEHKRVNASVAQEWKAVKAHKNATRRRTVFLDKAQRRALVSAAKGAARNLIEAAALTGARPGELVDVKRSQFDSRTGSITLKGKTGERTVPLSPAAIKLFNRLAKDKLPRANLLPDDNGNQWPHSGWDSSVREAVRKAKLPRGVVLYTLRHSWITEALKGGMTTLDVARLTGTSLPMIDAHYGHLVAAAARERLASVDML
ncbi:MAG: tyrosine-type recombinase/integrase [Woeseia sp.]